MCRVSIVLPVYNGEKYICKSLDSILIQSFKDWELIIINDCSTDASNEIISEYAKKDDRITVINNEVNRKLPTSLNIGFDHASGEYLTWTSDDNIYLNTAFEKMVRYLDCHKEMLVCAGMKSIDEDGRVFSEWAPYSDDFMFYQDCVGACFLYRREVIDDIGKYDTNRFLVEDYEYWLRILTHYGSIGYIDEKLYLYRFHAASLTGTRKKEIRTQLLRLRKSYIEDILNHYRDGNYFYLTRIYIDFLFDTSKEFDDVITLLSNKWSVLKKLKVLSDERNLIAFGAGNIGDKAFELLGDRIELYADKQAEKYDYCKNGIKIINPVDIPKHIYGRNLLITMTEEKVYEILDDKIISERDMVYLFDWSLFGF